MMLIKPDKPGEKSLLCGQFYHFSAAVACEEISVRIRLKRAGEGEKIKTS
jgi:hypothetical protein